MCGKMASGGSFGGLSSLPVPCLVKAEPVTVAGGYDCHIFGAKCKARFSLISKNRMQAAAACDFLLTSETTGYAGGGIP